MKDKRGFSRLELLVVVVIIAILITIAIPRFKVIKDEVTKTKVEKELKLLRAGVESYYMHEEPSAYPSAVVGVPGMTEPGLVSRYLSKATPLIVGEPLPDPFRGGMGEYSYYASSGSPSDPKLPSKPGEYYVIFSYGPNGVKEITGIDNDGYLLGTKGDDIYVTNGRGFNDLD